MLINQFYNLFLKEGKNLFTNENKFEKYVYDPFNRNMSFISESNKRGRQRLAYSIFKESL